MPRPPSAPASRLLALLERGAALLRRVGLGRLVERLGPAVGRAAAGRETVVDGLVVAGGHAGHLYYLRELERGGDAFLAELLRELAPPGGTVVEAGPHIGYLTLQLARAVGAGGTVHAFEPDPEVQETLRRNLHRNGLGDRVVLRAAAVGDRPGRAVLHLSGGGETSSLAPLDTARARAEVEVVRLDDALPPGTVVDLVKLDVEGAETAALRGLRGVLERSGARPALVVECNPSRLAAMGSSAAELLGLLAELGFGVWRIDEEARTLRRELAVGDEAYANLLCGRGGRLDAVSARYVMGERTPRRAGVKPS